MAKMNLHECVTVDKHTKKDMESKDVYKLELHESIILNKSNSGYTSVVRVPGGWIYKFVEHLNSLKQSYNALSTSTSVSVSSTFVPLPLTNGK